MPTSSPSGLWQFFLSLSDTTKTAIIASTITLLGTILSALVALIVATVTNHGHEKRFARQMEHERAKQRKDLEMTLRKQIYMDATDSVSVALSVIGWYADLNVSQETIRDALVSTRAGIAKVHLVGSQAAINALTNFSVEYLKKSMALVKLRQPLLNLKQQVVSLDETVRIHEARRVALVDQKNAYTFSGKSDERQSQFLSEGLRIEMQNVTDALTQKSELLHQIDQGTRPLLVASARTIAELQQITIELVRAARDELGLELNFDQYKSTIIETGKQACAFTEAIVQDLK